jgi:hypothetical protein
MLAHRPCRLKRIRRCSRSFTIRADSTAAAQPAAQAQPGWRSLLHSEHDALIVGLAVPALGSILLDPIMSMVDTGVYLHAACSTCHVILLTGTLGTCHGKAGAAC